MTTNSPTDTNQASEDELRAIIERYIDRAAVLAKQDGTSFNNKHLLKLDMATAIETIIRTEKLKLLDEVREQAEEYELNMHGFYDKDVSDQITAVPLEALAKLEAEL